MGDFKPVAAPDNFEDTINILAIDPGTTTIGVSIFKINVITLEIVDIETILVDTSVRLNSYELTTDLLLRLERLYNRVIELIEYYNPYIVSLENGFINRLRPAAYGPLSQSIMAIELAVLNTNKFIKIFKFAPKTIKKVTTSAGTAGKNDMLAGLKTIPEINRLIDPDLISEHEVDSVGVNYTMLQYLRENPLLLLII